MIAYRATLAREPGWLVVDAAVDRDTVRSRVLTALKQHLTRE